MAASCVEPLAEIKHAYIIHVIRLIENTGADTVLGVDITALRHESRFWRVKLLLKQKRLDSMHSLIELTIYVSDEAHRHTDISLLVLTHLVREPDDLATIANIAARYDISRNHLVNPGIA